MDRSPNAFQPFHCALSPGCDLPSSYTLRGVLCQGLVQSCCPCEASVHPCEMPLLRNTPGCSLQLSVVPGTAAGQSGFGGAVREPWEAGLEQAAACCHLGVPVVGWGTWPQHHGYHSLGKFFPTSVASKRPSSLLSPRLDCLCWSASLAEVMKRN